MPAIKEYQTVTNISGPLMLVEMVDEATDKVVAETRQRIKAQWANP